jgi:hypothetical protein
MGQTYTADMARTVDKVRFLARDNVVGAMILDDEEIRFLISENPNIYRAAAAAADSISATYANRIAAAGGAVKSKKVGPTEIAYDTGVTYLKAQQDAYTALATQLRARANQANLPVVTGQSVAESAANRADVDVPRPAFTQGEYDDPRLPGSRDRDDCLPWGVQ